MRMKHLGGLAAIALLASCGSADSGATSDGAVQAEGEFTLPAPSHELNGRTLTVRLPYDGKANLVWLLGQDDAAIAPFNKWDIDQSPIAGTGGRGGMTTMTFTADGPGTVSLDFLLVPAGSTLFGPPETRFTGTPSNKYQVSVTVE